MLLLPARPLFAHLLFAPPIASMVPAPSVGVVGSFHQDLCPPAVLVAAVTAPDLSGKAVVPHPPVRRARDTAMRTPGRECRQDRQCVPVSDLEVIHLTFDRRRCSCPF